MANLEHIFIRTGAGQCRDLMQAWADRPWDVLLADTLSTGAVLAAEATGCRWASVSVTPLALPGPGVPPPGLALRPARGPAGRLRDALWGGAYSLLTRPLHRAYNQTRSDAGLPPSRVRLDTAWFSPSLICVYGTPELDYPRPGRPSHIHYVGMVRKRRAKDWVPPPWWESVLADPRPLVHITQGTQNVDPSDLLRPALAALAPLDVQAVAVTGVPGRTGVGVALGGNAQVTDLVPYEILLPHVSLMVTNGGWGGVLAALSHGIPLIVAGGDIDKPEIAARVAHAGAGIDLRTGTPSVARIGAAVAAITADPRYATRAAGIAARLNELSAPEEIVRLVEDLAATPA